MLLSVRISFLSISTGCYRNDMTLGSALDTIKMLNLALLFPMVGSDGSQAAHSCPQLRSHFINIVNMLHYYLYSSYYLPCVLLAKELYNSLIWAVVLKFYGSKKTYMSRMSYAICHAISHAIICHTICHGISHTDTL